MRRTFAVFLLIGLSPVQGYADLMLGPDHFVKEAIEAHGGELKIDRYRGEVMKLEGKMDRAGKEFDFTGEFMLQLPGQFKHVVRFEVDGVKHETIAVFNSDKGWRNRDGETEEMGEREIALAKDMLHAYRVSRLTVIPNDRGFKLMNLNSASNPSVIDGVRAWEIKVSFKGEKDVVLCIGDQKKLLIKVQRDLQLDDKKTLKLEESFSDYKEVNGVQRPFKRSTTLDGKKTNESKATEIKLFEQLDDKEFAKP